MSSSKPAAGQGDREGCLEAQLAQVRHEFQETKDQLTTENIILGEGHWPVSSRAHTTAGGKPKALSLWALPLSL